MKRLNCTKMRLVLIGIVAAMVLGGGSAKADFTFGQPVNLGSKINTSRGDCIDCFSADGLEMYFDCIRSGGYGNWDIYVAKRETIDDDWGAPVNLGPTINTSHIDGCASISFDGLELYFSSDRPGGHGRDDIWLSTRPTKDAEWGTPVNLGPIVNSSAGAAYPWISTDGLELYFTSTRPGGYGDWDIWMSRRATRDDAWSPPVNLGPVVNSSASEAYPSLSPDGLCLFFSEDWNSPVRPGGFGNADMWMTRRASVSDPWGTPVNLGPIVNSPSLDTGPRISPDGSTLYFSSARPGGYGGMWGDIYQAPIIPIVDFNGDGKVDKADMHIMVDHWGENYSLCDIGPTPLGDGIVDIEDLIVLSEHLFEDYRLVAHWALDEDAGNTAYDSAGQYDAALQGGPIWQPEGGKVSGALQFDGINDYVETPFILDPSKGSFSVFAWIYSWTPGQVIISQTGNFGSTWLGTDPTGKLMTGLGDIYFGALVSETVITDFQWHHVGFVYDMDTLHRRLYVDGVLITEDTTVVYGAPSNNGMYIGASKDLETGTFFSGLIDDVRIYKQALTTGQIAALAQ